MFRKFTADESVGGSTQVKTSVARNIKKKLLESYPMLSSILDDIFPKKIPIFITKCKDRVSLLVCNNIVWFFQLYTDGYIPTLKTLHKYPMLLKHVGVDRGAIKFVLSGANIMCRGVTSPGGSIEPGIEENEVVAIMAEGKQHALAIGKMRLSSDEIIRVNSDIGIELLHYLSDGLYHYVPQ